MTCIVHETVFMKYLFCSLNCTCNVYRRFSSNTVTVARYLVLAEEEGQQHQHASIVDDPPHVNVTLGEALSIGREGRDVLRDEQSQVSGGGFSDQLCRTDTCREAEVLAEHAENLHRHIITGFRILFWLS